MAEDQLGKALEQFSDQTKQLLSQKQKKDQEARRQAMGIDTELRVLATDEKLHDFLESRETDLELVMSKEGRGPVLRVNSGGEVICSRYGDNEYTNIYRLETISTAVGDNGTPVDSKARAVFADFIDQENRAFVRVGGIDVFAINGDFLAREYFTNTEPFAGASARSLDQQAVTQIKAIAAGK